MTLGPDKKVPWILLFRIALGFSDGFCADLFCRLGTYRLPAKHHL